ncbi:hypothetical protein [Paenibacillus humicus]|uniref:hypothetical protein n=1 Tax=Paenibacillus humicus TaxID=412861 RepID=UPI003F5CD0AC
MGHVRRFLDHQLSDPHRTVQVYSLHLLEKGQSHFYVNQAISALKFYMKLTGDENVGSYVRPKKETKLPNVLSTEKSPSCSAP